MARKSQYSKRILVGLYPTVAKALADYCEEYEETFSSVINICLIKCLDSKFWHQ